MRVRVSLITLLALLAGGLASAPAPAQEQIPALTHYLSAQQRREDPRLERLVTVWYPRIQIGELLALLSEQTGIEILPQEEGNSADEMVTVFLKERPVFEVLNALWSLVSFQGAEWHWRRSGAEGNYRYRLIRPDAAEELQERLLLAREQELPAVLAAAVARGIAALSLAPEELQRRAAADPIALAHVAESELARVGLRIFAEVVDAEARRAVLRGERPARVQAADLPEWAQAALRAEAARRPRTRVDPQTGERLPVPPPAWLEFQRQSLTDDSTVSLRLRTETFGSQDLVGGEAFRHAVTDWLKQGWLSRLDRTEHPAEARALPGLPLPAPLFPEALVRVSFNGRLTWTRRAPRDPAVRLGQLAEAVEVPVLALLQPGLGGAGWTARGPETLRERLAAFARPDRGSPSWISKWREDVLVVLDTGCLHLPFPAPPRRLVRALRQAEAAAEGGFLPLEAVARAARELEELPVGRLEEFIPRALPEFSEIPPDAQARGFRMIRLTQLQDLFPMLDMFEAEFWLGVDEPQFFVVVGALRLYASSPELAARLRTEAGVPVPELRPLAAPLECPTLNRLLTVPGAAALRVVVEDDLEHAPPLRWVRFQALGAGGQVVSDLSFNYWRRPR